MSHFLCDQSSLKSWEDLSEESGHGSSCRPSPGKKKGNKGEPVSRRLVNRVGVGMAAPGHPLRQSTTFSNPGTCIEAFSRVAV